MAATTRWRDTVIQSVDEAVGSLIDDVLSDENVGNITWDNWNLQSAFSQSQHIQLNGRAVEYNYVKYSYEQTTIGDVYVEDRIVKREGFIIVYNNGSGINYIIDQNSSAMKLLRKLLSYTNRNEIEKNSFELTNDFFIWLIYRAYHANYNIEMVPENQELKIASIKGFKGDTDDLQTKVSASGETVMNIISTLSFLLESSNLNQVKLDLNFTEHPNISLLLQKGTVNAYFNDYVGTYESEEQLEQKISKLYLTIYLEILPMLVQEYNTDIGNDLWNREVYIDFMKNVAETLTQKIQTKIVSLNVEENNNN